MQDGPDNHATTRQSPFDADADRPVRIDDPFARRLVTRYLARREGDLVTLREAVGKKDFELIERTGHNLFGSGSAYGLDVVSSLGACIEIAAKKHDAARITQLIDDLEKFVRHLKIA